MRTRLLTWRTVVLGATLFANFLASPARGAVCDPYSRETLFSDSDPSDGDVGVPTNVEVRLRYLVGGECPLTSAPTHVPVLRPKGSSDPDDEVTLDVEVFAFQRTWMYVLTPTTPLDVLTTYEVFGLIQTDLENGLACADGIDSELVEFTTGDGPDEVPPTVNAISWNCTTTTEGSTWNACYGHTDDRSRTVLTFEDASDDRSAGLAFDIYASAAAVEPAAMRVEFLWGNRIIVTGFDDMDFEAIGMNPPELNLSPGNWSIVAVDGAGNRSAPFEVGEPPGACTTWSTPPTQPPVSNCASAGPFSTDSKTPAALLALAVLAFARSRRSVRP